MSNGASATSVSQATVDGKGKITVQNEAAVESAPFDPNLANNASLANPEAPQDGPPKGRGKGKS